MPISKFKLSRWKFRLNVAVWIFPLIAIILSGWLFIDYMKTRGPLVEIRFPDAADIEAQKTVIKYRGIKVGLVEDVELSRDGRQVIVHARLVRHARSLAVKGSQFRVIQPQVGFEGVQGLETLFKGVYIQLEPGPADAEVEDTFVGRDNSESAKQIGGVAFTLRSRLVDSIGTGDPVTYRGMKVGEVLRVSLDRAAQWVETRIQIERRYGYLVRSNSVFWRKRAVKADMSLFGASVEIASLESMMKGGIAFATPNAAGKIAGSQNKFSLEESEPKGWKEWIPNLSPDQSVAGIEPEVKTTELPVKTPAPVNMNQKVKN